MRNATLGESSAAPVPARNTRSTDLQRRRMLFALGAGGAGAVVAVAGTSPASAATQSAAAPPDDRSSSYAVTEHVRDYYRTTKI